MPNGTDEEFQRTTTTSFTIDDANTAGTSVTPPEGVDSNVQDPTPDGTTVEGGTPAEEAPVVPGDTPPVDNTDTGSNTDTESTPPTSDTTDPTAPDGTGEVPPTVEEETPPPTEEETTPEEPVEEVIEAIKLTKTKNSDGNMVFLNGRQLNQDENETLYIRQFKLDSSSIDLLVEFSKGSNYAEATIETDDVDIVVTDCAGNGFGDDERALENGRIKLLQIVNTSYKNKVINLTITVDGIQYIQVIQVYTDVAAPSYQVALKDADNGSIYNPDGDENYPLSVSAMPIPIYSNRLQLVWMWNNQKHDIDSDELVMNVIYNTTQLTVENEEDIIRGRVENINKFTFNIDNSVLDPNNVNKPDFYFPIVIEYQNKKGVVVSSRSYLLTRVKTTILDDWGVKSNNYFIDRTDNKNGTYLYSIPLEYPKLDILLSPYLDRLLTLGNTEVNEKINSMISLTPTDNDPTFRASITGSRNGYELEVFYNETLPKTTKIKLTSHNYSNPEYDTLHFYNKTATPVVTGKYAEIQNIELGRDNNLDFTLTNGATIEFDVLPENGPIPTVTLNSVYKQSLPYNNNTTYPVQEGTVSFRPTNEPEGVYEYTMIIKDCRGVEKGRSKITVRLIRPVPKPTITFLNRLYPINIAAPVYLPVLVNDVYRVEVMNFSEADNEEAGTYTAEVVEIDRSDAVQDSGTYRNFNFKLKITGTRTGPSTGRMVFYDDRYKVLLNQDFRLDMYTTEYVPEDTTPETNDHVRGLQVEISYKQKNGFVVPLVFMNNGEEVDGILVPKYPLPQEVIDEVDKDSGEKLYTTISKKKTHRMWYIPSSKSTETEGDGDYFKLCNPKYLEDIREGVVYNSMLNGNCYPVMNSSYLDTMLANIHDANVLAGHSKHKWYMDGIASNAEDVNRIFGYWNGSGYKYTDDEKWSYSGYKVNTSKVAQHDLIDVANDIAVPLIEDNISTSHNGQLCGIMDAFGAGIKVYTDIFVTNKDSEYSLTILDPIIGKLEWYRDYATNEPKLYNKIEFKDNLFFPDVERCYIGSNEFKEGRMIAVYTGSDYDKDDWASLMDGCGIPINTIIYDYKGIEVFQGNVGYSKTNSYRHGDSLWCTNLSKIENGDTAYFVSGLFGNNKLLLTDEEHPNDNRNHIANLYPNLINSATGGNRTRMLVTDRAVYNYNRGNGNKSDQIYFNNRMHFLVYDSNRMSRKDPTRLKIVERNLFVEEGYTIDIEMITDAEEDGISWSGVNEEFITFDGKTITAVKEGETSFTITAQKSKDHNPNSKVINVTVTPAIPDTEFRLDITSNNSSNKNNGTGSVGGTEDNPILDGMVLDIFNFDIVVPEGTDVTAQPTNTTIVESEVIRVPDKDPLPEPNATVIYAAYTIKVTMIAKGTTDVVLKAQAENCKMVSKMITCRVKERKLTYYQTENNILMLSKEEVGKAFTTTLLRDNIVFKGTNISSVDELAVWSPDLPGAKYTINSKQNFAFNVDFGAVSKTVYTIYYKAQLRQKWNKVGAGQTTLDDGNITLPTSEPEATIVNTKDNIVTGNVQIIIPYITTNPVNLTMGISGRGQFTVKTNLPQGTKIVAKTAYDLSSTAEPGIKEENGVITVDGFPAFLATNIASIGDNTEDMNATNKSIEMGPEDNDYVVVWSNLDEINLEDTYNKDYIEVTEVPVSQAEIDAARFDIEKRKGKLVDLVEVSSTFSDGIWTNVYDVMGITDGSTTITTEATFDYHKLKVVNNVTVNR